MANPVLQAPPRLAVVDDHGIMRGVFLTLMEDSPEFSVAWLASSITEARECILRDLPDLLVMDVGLPDGNGFDFVREVLRLTPQLPVLMLSALEDKSYPDRARGCGARGFIAKNTSLNVIVDAVSCILKGGSWFSQNSTNRPAENRAREIPKQPST